MEADGAAAGSADPGSAVSRLSGLDPDADPVVVQILATEHWSVLAQRSLVYNEAFTRVATFLTLVSMSLVGLALLAQVMNVGSGLLTVAAVTLVFDLVVGFATIARVLGAVDDDLRAMHGMSRIRHGYIQLVPELRPYFTAPVHDDLRSVMAGYGPAHSGFTGFVYFLSTSLGLMVLLVSLIAGVTVVLTVMAFGATGGIAAAFGVATVVAVFVALGVVARQSILRGQDRLESLFPSTGGEHDATA